MEIINVEQRSNEWDKLRGEYYKTASRTPIVMGLSPFSTKEKLARELLYKETTPLTPAMIKGIEMESHILKRAESEYFKECEFAPLVAVNGVFMASLDAYNANKNIILEIKASSKTTKDLANGIVPEHYYAQIQHQLMVCNNSSTAYLVAYDTKGDELKISEPILPDFEFQNKIKEAWDNFDSYLLKFKDNNVVVEDEHYLKLALEFEANLQIIKELEDQNKALKEALKELIIDKDKIFVGNIIISKNKGAKKPDYLKFLNEKNIDIKDLDNYVIEGKESIVFRVSKRN